MGPPSAQSYAKNTAAEANNTALSSADQGSKIFQNSYPALEQAIAYYRKLASGNPAAVNTAVAPQVNQIENQYNAAVEAAGRNGPRGGAAADAATQLQLQRTGQIAGAKEAAVAAAPNELESAGAGGTQLSQNAITNALNAFATSGNIDLELLKPEQDQQNNEINAFTQLASFLMG